MTVKEAKILVSKAGYKVKEDREKSPEAYWEMASPKDQKLCRQIMEDWEEDHSGSRVMAHLGFYMENIAGPGDMRKSGNTLVNIINQYHR
jgi:hypothetical protein